MDQAVTIAPIFTNRSSFFPESKDESIKTIIIEPSKKIPWLWVLGAKNYIETTCAQKMYQAISPEPYH